MIISSSDDFILAEKAIEILTLKLKDCKYRNLKLSSMELLGRATDLSDDEDDSIEDGSI